MTTGPCNPSWHQRPIIVIGSGISGLAAAHRLLEPPAPNATPPTPSSHATRPLPPGLAVTVLEAGERCGGVIRTIERDGFLLDAGPDNFITTKPWALDLSRRLGLTDRLLPTTGSAAGAMVVRRGRLLPVPEGFLLMAPTRWWPIVSTPIFSLTGKLRMALERFLPRRAAAEGDDESLASFVTRRFGREALERLVQPLISGIYTAVPETLSLRATMPQFLQMEREHGSVIRGMRRAASKQRKRAASKQGQRADSGARYSMFLTYRAGMRELVDALVQRIGAGAIQTGCRVAAITRAEPSAMASDAAIRWRVHLSDGRVLPAAAVILTGPARGGAALLAGVDRRLAEALAQVEYASTAVVHLGYQRQAIRHALNAYGFVVPRGENRRIIAASFCSVKYEGRAPAGTVLIRAVLGGALQPGMLDCEDDELMLAAHGELAELLGIDGPPILSVIHRHHGAMPQYHVGHLDRVAAIRRLLTEHPGLGLAGNGYEGVGVPDCIHAGESAAERVLADLASADAGQDANANAPSLVHVASAAEAS